MINTQEKKLCMIKIVKTNRSNVIKICFPCDERIEHFIKIDYMNNQLAAGRIL